MSYEKLEIPATGYIDLPNGCTLYWRPNEVGGRTYYSDECGVAAMIWDTAIACDSTLLAALTQEAKIRYMESVNADRERRGLLDGKE